MRKTRGPFVSLKTDEDRLHALGTMDHVCECVETGDQEGVDAQDCILECMDNLKAELDKWNCLPVGTAAGHCHDEGNGDDISELVMRSMAHAIQEPDPGILDSTTHVVRVRLSTLRAEVDVHGEICAWTYEEY